MRVRSLVGAFALVVLACGQAFAQPPLQFAELGDLTLENGQVIQDCRIGYRTFGTLNPQRSNAILFPTWFAGTSEHLARLIGPGKLVDSTDHYVIAVDALGNGVTSSPSNSTRQPGEAFPQFTIRDMVRSQYRLLTEVLGISHLKAVIGGSMGGMQVFEWIVSHPDFMDEAIAYVGSPRLTSYDLLLWEAELRAIEAGRECDCPEETIGRLVATIQSLVMQTPAYRVRQTSRQQFPRFLATMDSIYASLFVADNWASQLKAMMAHDVSAPFDGSLENAAAAVRAELLVIVASQDHVVNPQPALEFARLVGARVLELQSDCGHVAVGCEMERVVEAVAEFMER